MRGKVRARLGENRQDARKGKGGVRRDQIRRKVKAGLGEKRRDTDEEK
jgi:hypothetical protein